jgi:4-hydroxy 2-oxovalerate aldolase
MNCIKLFDCTLRDGGYVNNWQFTKEQVRECYKACLASGVSYMEIGFRNFDTIANRERYGETFFCTESYINEVIGDIVDDTKCKIAVMVTINQFNMNDFVNKIESKAGSKISLVRVLMAYHGFKNKTDDELDLKTLSDGIEQINKLNDMGYEVSFNIGRIDKLSDEQLYVVLEAVSKTKIKYFYVADTYGSSDNDSISILVIKMLHIFRNLLNNDLIELGFHAHDNFSNASTKSIHAWKMGCKIIDGCILGYGRGSGNAKIELLMMDLNKNHNYIYDFIHVIEYGNKYLIGYKECINNLSYNVVYAICAYLGCHVTYGIEIIENYEKMSIIEIYLVLKEIKKQNKHMFFYDKLFMEVYHQIKN